ncbi:uncharacterized protein LOC132748128 isoform X1 [Ruditapes philippinarum]|uniref:uncharacterized protein LOC132748128 isoform X1 n=1 Tax=Ruditapes philippinarum TaxID=129788 RepID=UPI00295BD433|nr:uncharacterized protein LOC132748128 isoform X1 [Ruditapes philippinarum]
MDRQTRLAPMTSNMKQLDYLDKTLDYINIIKINTSGFKKNEHIQNQDDLENAEGIIDEITNGRKRKSSFKTNAPNSKIARTDPNLSIPSETVKATQGHGYKFKQLFLQSQVMDMLKQKRVNFEVHLYLVENHISSKFSKAFSEIVTKECKQKLRQDKEVTKSYMLFFYRNVKKGKFFTPEIYALSTGFAWRVVKPFAEMNFAKHVERRVLSFPCTKFHYDLIDGHISSISKLARPGREITFTTWDFLGILVKNRTRQIRDNSSLYSSKIDAFVTKTGKHIPTKFQVGKNKLKIQRKLKLSQLGRLLEHFSKIISNEKPTYLINDKKEEEKDNPLFQMYDFVSQVTKKGVRENLNKKLNKTLQDSMDGKNSTIYLMHKKKSVWSKADEFSLRCLDKSASGSKKKHYKTIKKWNVFPKLDDVMRALKKEYTPKFQPEWLDNVIIEFRNIKAALKECIFRRFIVGGIGTYIYNHGEWIEMKAEYLYCIERDFVEILKHHCQSDLPLLLPWKHLCKKGEKKKDKKKDEQKFQLQQFKTETMVPKWKSHY